MQQSHVRVNVKKKKNSLNRLIEFHSTIGWIDIRMTDAIVVANIHSKQPWILDLLPDLPNC